MLIGYARVSTQDQNLELQRDALLHARCERIFEDKISGVKLKRPGLLDAIASMLPGDTLVIWKLSRLGRSVKQLIETLQLLSDRGIDLKSLHENIDTSTATGKLLFHVLAAFAQFERDNQVENTLAGLVSARARGRIGGRQSVMSENKQAQALALLSSFPELPVAGICEAIGISRSTFYRHNIRHERLEVAQTY